MLQELIPQDESDDEEYKDMRWTKIWALLLVCVIQADAKLKWRFFKVNKFRGVYFREGFFREIF